MTTRNQFDDFEGFDGRYAEAPPAHSNPATGNQEPGNLTAGAAPPSRLVPNTPEFEAIPGRSVQSTGLPRVFYQIHSLESYADGQGREKVRNNRTLSVDALAELGDETPVHQVPEYAGFELADVLKILTPAQRAVVEAILADEGSDYGKVQRVAQRLEKNAKTTDALWRKARAQLIEHLSA